MQWCKSKRDDTVKGEAGHEDPLKPFFKYSHCST